MTNEKKDLLVVIAYYGDPVGNLKTQTDLIRLATKDLGGIKNTRILVSGHDNLYHTADSDIANKLINRKEWGEDVEFISAKDGTFALAYLNAYVVAAKSDADYVVVMDSGLSHDPSDLGIFVEGLKRGADVVAGSRNVKDARNEYPWHRKLVSGVGTLLSQGLLGMKLKDCTSGYIGYTREALNKILESRPIGKWISEKVGPYFLQTEERFMASSLGMKVLERPIQYGVLNEGRAGILKPKILFKAGTGLIKLIAGKIGSSNKF